MKSEYRRKSLSWKILLLFVAMAVIIDVAITAVSSNVYKNKLISEQERVCQGVSATVAAEISEISDSKVSEWATDNKNEEYYASGEKFVNIMDSFSEIKSIRVCIMGSNDMHVLYNYSRDDMTNSMAGQKQVYDGYLEDKRDALIEGKTIDVIMSRKDDGDIMASLTAVKDKMNKVMCYSICEISTENIQSKSIDFAKKTFLSVGLVSLLLALLMSFYVHKTVVSPLGKIDKTLRMFAGDSNVGEETKDDLSKIKVKSRDEINAMHDGFIKLIDEVSMKNNEVKEFDAELMKRMQEVIKEDE